MSGIFVLGVSEEFITATASLLSPRSINYLWQINWKCSKWGEVPDLMMHRYVCCYVWKPFTFNFPPLNNLKFGISTIYCVNQHKWLLLPSRLCSVLRPWPLICPTARQSSFGPRRKAQFGGKRPCQHPGWLLLDLTHTWDAGACSGVMPAPPESSQDSSRQTMGQCWSQALDVKWVTRSCSGGLCRSGVCDGTNWKFWVLFSAF